LVDLIPTFGNTLFTLVAFVVALSIIVAVHEYGHYIVGRWCGIKAEVFSLGFGPVLWSKPDKHGTVWQVAALPFGGFVKFLGDADAASAGTDDAFKEMDEAAKRNTMHGAPLWARAATVAAGPVFNFILSIAIFGAFAFSLGTATEPVEVAKMKPLPATYGALLPGDKILEIGGFEVKTIADLGNNAENLPETGAISYRVSRDGAEQIVEGPFPLPPLVGSITPGFGADKAGLQVGDVIISIDGEEIVTFFQLQRRAIASEGRELALKVWRDGEVLDFTFATKLGAVPTDNGMEERWLIGMGGDGPFIPAVRSLGVFESVKIGAQRTSDVITGSFSGLYSMVVGDIGTCNLSGPVGIARASGAAASQGISNFIWLIAVISTAVGMLNLFPIPVLDGGHLVFHAYEAVTGKPPSDGALRILMGAGLVMILSLMVFALTNDFFCP